MFSVTLGAILTPKRNWKQWLCNILESLTKRIMVCYGIFCSGRLRHFFLFWVLYFRPSRSIHFGDVSISGYAWALLRRQRWLIRDPNACTRLQNFPSYRCFPLAMCMFPIIHLVCPLIILYNQYLHFFLEVTVIITH